MLRMGTPTCCNYPRRRGAACTISATEFATLQLTLLCFTLRLERTAQKMAGHHIYCGCVTSMHVTSSRTVWRFGHPCLNNTQGVQLVQHNRCVLSQLKALQVVQARVPRTMFSATCYCWSEWISNCQRMQPLCNCCCCCRCRIEPEYGRSRVFAQWLNTEDELQSAIGEFSLHLTTYLPGIGMLWVAARNW